MFCIYLLYSLTAGCVYIHTTSQVAGEEHSKSAPQSAAKSTTNKRTNTKYPNVKKILCNKQPKDFFFLHRSLTSHKRSSHRLPPASCGAVLPSFPLRHVSRYIGGPLLHYPSSISPSGLPYRLSFLQSSRQPLSIVEQKPSSTQVSKN